jgi:formamidopyrimidine-DNA glycosylase
MPSLPELEVYRRQLAPLLAGQPLTRVEPLDYRVVRATSQDLDRVLVGRTVTSIGRYGKWLWLDTGLPDQVIIHLGLTGALQIVPADAQQPKYAALALHFGTQRLVLADQRHLGRVYVRPFADLKTEKGLGPDVLDVTEDEFVKALQGKRRGVHDVLSDQYVVAGIGGKYNDEILWQARVHPNTKVDKLTPEQLRELYLLTESITRTAIELDGDVERFPGDWLIPHRKTDKLCPRGHGPLSERTSGGNSSLHCPVCQPAPNPSRTG